jgi:hypothetical protein
MSRIRIKTAVAALLVAATAVTVTAPVVGAADAASKPAPKAILKAIL